MMFVYDWVLSIQELQRLPDAESRIANQHGGAPEDECLSRAECKCCRPEWGALSFT